MTVAELQADLAMFNSAITDDLRLVTPDLIAAAENLAAKLSTPGAADLVQTLIGSPVNVPQIVQIILSGVKYQKMISGGVGASIQKSIQHLQSNPLELKLIAAAL